MELEQVILHQDNAPLHRAQSTLLRADLLGFERLEHSPQLPRLITNGLWHFLTTSERAEMCPTRKQQRTRVTHAGSCSEVLQTVVSTVYDQQIHRHKRFVDAEEEYFVKLVL